MAIQSHGQDEAKAVAISTTAAFIDVCASTTAWFIRRDY